MKHMGVRPSADLPLDTVTNAKIIVPLKYLLSISKFGDRIVHPSYALMQTYNKKREQFQNMNE